MCVHAFRAIPLLTEGIHHTTRQRSREVLPHIYLPIQTNDCCIADAACVQDGALLIYQQQKDIVAQGAISLRAPSVEELASGGLQILL